MKVPRLGHESEEGLGGTLCEPDNLTRSQTYREDFFPHTGRQWSSTPNPHGSGGLGRKDQLGTYGSTDDGVQEWSPETSPSKTFNKRGDEPLKREQTEPFTPVGVYGGLVSSVTHSGIRSQTLFLT